MKEFGKKVSADVYAIWGTIILLVAIGLIMIYSASANQYVNSEWHNYDSMFLLKRQMLFAVVGIGFCFVCQYINYSILYRVAMIMYVAGIALIFLLKTPLGVSVKGATRWLNILGVQFQVAEFIKISVIIIMAYMVQKFSNHLSKIMLVIYMWAIGGGAAFLLLIISNDLSSSLVVLGITFGITFVFTNTERFHIVIGSCAVLAITLYVFNIWQNMPTAEELQNMSFRVGRIAAWLNPEMYASDQGYQSLQALYAIGSGGFWGKGLGNSTQKLKAIPEAQNDMIFSIVCEELGILGATLIIVLIVYLCWQLVKVANSSDNLFGSTIVTGVLIHIALQSFINIGVNVNLLPNTGIGLPFISYGGTAVFCQLLEIAITLSVCRVSQNYKTVNIYKYLKGTKLTSKKNRQKRK